MGTQPECSGNEVGEGTRRLAPSRSGRRDEEHNHPMRCTSSGGVWVTPSPVEGGD